MFWELIGIAEAIPMSTQNICFHGEIRQKSYLELWCDKCYALQINNGASKHDCFVIVSCIINSLTNTSDI